MPTASLIVSTFEWPRALELVLRSVLVQTQLPQQVVVADDGSGDETEALVRDFVRRFRERGVACEHVWQPNQGFRVAAIRNRALARCTGDYVLQVDGDCVLHRDFVRSHLAFARPGAFTAGSRVLLLPERTRSLLAEGRFAVRLWESGLKNRQNGLSLPWLSRLVRASQDPLAPTRGCNVAYWRRDAEAVNGFDERFVGWGREDSEFGARLLAAGVRRRKLKFGGIVYHLWHPPRPADAVDAQQRLYESVVAAGHRRCVVGLDHVAGAAASTTAHGLSAGGLSAGGLSSAAG